MHIRCAVACQGFDGPAFYFCVVRCTRAQYDEGEHYEAAKDQAVLAGYDEPMVPFDEKDGPRWLFKHGGGWSDVDRIEVDALL
jgi:hypothetical protein